MIHVATSLPKGTGIFRAVASGRGRAYGPSASLGGVAFVHMRLVGVYDSLWVWGELVAGVGGALLLQAIRIRIKEELPFCIHCGYCLRGLPDNRRCPECGARYSFGECLLYQKDPIGYRERKENEDWIERQRIVSDFFESQRRKKDS